MSRKATTIRLNPMTQTALAILSRVLKRPMNQLVNEAVTSYVKRRGSEVEHDLAATLTSLRAYRVRDPHFKAAIAAFVDAEARLGKEDPAEGKVVIGTLVDGRLVEERTGKSADLPQSEVRRLLNAP
jgi:predicted transcriptional regulator